MLTQPASNHVSDIRYALAVLEEYSHLGLDDEYANKLREILERQLEETDETTSCSTPQPVRFPAAAK
jgi:hypothetical protein